MEFHRALYSEPRYHVTSPDSILLPAMNTAARIVLAEAIAVTKHFVRHVIEYGIRTFLNQYTLQLNSSSEKV
jgi:hypothetical protein